MIPRQSETTQLPISSRRCKGSAFQSMQHCAVALAMCSHGPLKLTSGLCKGDREGSFVRGTSFRESIVLFFSETLRRSVTLRSASSSLVYWLLDHFICHGLDSRGAYPFNVYPSAAFRATMIVTPTGVPVGSKDTRAGSGWMMTTGFRHWDMTARVSDHHKNRLDYSFNSVGGSTRVAWLGRLTNASTIRSYLGYCPMITKYHAPPGYATDVYASRQPFHWVLDT